MGSSKGEVDGQQVLGQGALIGARLGGRYEVRSLLGQGGMADVYSAQDTVLGRTVAVKVLRGSLTSESRSLARFREEAEAAAALAHPNIVSLFDIGTDDRVPFIVMELIPGESLSEVIWREAPLPPERAAEIGEAVADALGFAHAAGIVHRDIKPGNIMLTPWGHVKVLDFGIARALSRARLTTSMELRGTAEYLSPEQAKGGDLDGRSDIYSLGAVMFEMLTGRPPFEAESALAVARMQVETEPMPVRRLRASVPIPLETIVMRCLAKEPAGRYQRAAQLAADLRRFRFDRSAITAPVPSEPSTDPLDREEAVARKRRRGRRIFAVAFSVIALLATLAAFMVPPLLREPVSPPRSQTLDPPSGIRAHASCEGLFKTKIDLTWSPSPAQFADGYIVYRSASAEGPFEKLDIVSGRDSRSYTDGALNHGSTFFYRLSATSRTRIGAPSPPVRAVTPGLISCVF
ncbi:MAG TPA: protein kinase [Actinomycetota bacterium]|nr:protein kinase [Actinomycetota bacterium]